jgi:hypothetical protein
MASSLPRARYSNRSAADCLRWLSRIARDRGLCRPLWLSPGGDRSFGIRSLTFCHPVPSAARHSVNAVPHPWTQLWLRTLPASAITLPPGGAPLLTAKLKPGTPAAVHFDESPGPVTILGESIPIGLSPALGNWATSPPSAPASSSLPESWVAPDRRPLRIHAPDVRLRGSRHRSDRRRRVWRHVGSRGVVAAAVGVFPESSRISDERRRHNRSLC